MDGRVSRGGQKLGVGPRQHYIDWVRVLAVLLLFPFHVSRVFNAGEDFYVKAQMLSTPLTYTVNFISTWHMQLLFLLAGMSTYYALGKRTGRKYAWERVKRLLLPFVFGFLVLIPPQTWYGAQFNSGYTDSYWHYLTSGDWLVFNVRDGGDYYGGFGIGHLWFILALFIMSLVVLPLLVWGRTGPGGRRLRSVGRRLGTPAWWLLPALVILIAEGLPDPTMLHMIYYFAFFVLGYLVMWDGKFIASALRFRWPALVVGLALCLVWSLTGEWRDSQPDPSVQLFLIAYAGGLGAWLALAGFLGFGKRYLDRPSSALSYLSEASYPVYILHQTVIVVLAFYLVAMPGPLPLMWLVILAASVVATFALYEIVRRVALLRVLFGMRPLARPLLSAQEEKLPAAPAQ